MEYKEILENARNTVGPFCKACPVCNGKGCGNKIPGPGSKGIGDTAIRNYDKWQEFRINMDTIRENKPVDTCLNIFGKTFSYPIFAAPVGAVKMHYGEKFNDMEYNQILVKACAEAGITAFTGDGVDEQVMISATQVIKENNGYGIPTVKPWSQEIVSQKMSMVNKSGAFAVAMDIDAAGLPFLKNLTPPAGSKSVSEMKAIIAMTDKPFIVKGIMTPKGALKAKEAGAAAIVVSNHGGRVLDQCSATAEVLADIVDAVKGQMKIFVDGGIRTGLDVFKALAIGADGVLIGRPFVTAVYGGGEEGAKVYVKKLGEELRDAMAMCGAGSLKEISREMVRL